MTRLETIQSIVGVDVDDDWGPKTQAAVSLSLGLNASSSIKDIQLKVGSSPDGIGGPNTFAAILASLNHAPVELGSDLASAIVAIAEKEVGSRENGRNTGKKVREYQSADWLDGTGYAWCASFVCWVIQKAGERAKLPFKRPRTAGAWDFERWAKKQNLPVIKKPKTIKAGDLVVFTFSHIGIAVSDSSGGWVKTVEGNTNQAGSREGDGVYFKTRRLSQIRSRIKMS